MDSAKQKNQQIEYIRAIATIAVIAIHTVNSAIIYKGEIYSEKLVLVAMIIKNLLYWAVPCFGMISGMLLLNPGKTLTVKKIFGKYFFRILIVLLLFGTAFSWLELVFSSKSVSISQLPKAILLVVTYKSWAHLWYLYALLTVYLLLPLYRLVVSREQNWLLYVLTAVAFSAMILLQNRFISLHFYFLAGEIIRRKLSGKFKKASILTLAASGLLIVVCTIMKNALSFKMDFLFGYTSALTAAMSVAIFYLLYNIVLEKIPAVPLAVGRHLSAKSFGIYLVHMVFVNIEYQALHLHLLSNIASVFVILVLIVVNLIAAYLVATVMKLIPGLKKII